MTVSLSLVATMFGGFLAQAKAASHPPKRSMTLVLHPKWHVVARSGVVGVLGNGRYVFVEEAAGSGVLIDEQTEKPVVLTPPAGCGFDVFNSRAFGGSWVVATCNLLSGATRYELYSIPRGTWTPVRPDLERLFASGPCASGDPQCEASYIAIGSRWIEFQVTCGYHCGPTTFGFQNIQSGRVHGQPSGWKPGGTEIPDLNSPTLTRTLCKPFRVPNGFSDSYSGPAPGTIDFYGRFAVAFDWYLRSDGYVDQRYVLERCGSHLHQVLLGSVPGGFPLAINSYAVIWPDLGLANSTIHGAFLPSGHRFKIRNVPISRPPPALKEVQQVVLTQRTLYVLDWSGRLYAAARPLQRKQ
jgi:hypothetical protein